MSPLAKGWVVALAGLGINVALGCLGTWHVVADALTVPLASGGVHGWTPSQASLPFTVALAAFALATVPGGRLRDRYGPRWVSTLGGVLTGLGMLVASLSPRELADAHAVPVVMIAGLGLLTGTGVGLAYVSAASAVYRWFTPRRQGLLAGAAVAGFVSTPGYAAPLTATFLGRLGVNETLLVLGVLSFCAVGGLSQLLADPPKGYVPPGSYAERHGPIAMGPSPLDVDLVRAPMTQGLWALWLILAGSAFALTTTLATTPASAQGFWVTGAMRPDGMPAAWLALPLAAAVGAVGFGWLSDRIGSSRALRSCVVVLSLSAGFRLLVADTRWAVPVVSCALAAGGLLALTPTITFDLYGHRHAGGNHGVAFTAWGAGILAGLAAIGARFPGTSVADARPHVWVAAAAACAFPVLLTAFLRYPASAPAAESLRGMPLAEQPVRDTKRG